LIFLGYSSTLVHKRPPTDIGPVLDPRRVIAVPRKVRDSNLETRTARARLRVQHKPYFRLIEPGLHLGYRRLAGGPGTWLVRRYSGEGRYTAENLRAADGAIVLADDFEDADGEQILSFAQAQRVARGPRGQRQSPGGYTVANAAEDYLRFLESDGRSPHSIRDTRYRIEGFVLPHLGNLKLGTLTADRLRRWRDEIAKAPPRLRTRDGEQQKHRGIAGEDSKRARRATTNRTWTTLRAALNHAFSEGKTDTDVAWRKIKPFRAVETARVRYLSIAEAKRLINACDPDFRPLVQAALQTGARYGELCRLQVADFNPDAGTLHIRQSKSGKARHVVLSDEGRGLFTQQTAGRAGSEPMFGKTWDKSHQARPMREAVRRAKIKPAISFHGLRHTWASLGVMAGMPLMVVARNLGHADTRMVERFYGHLAPSFIADEIRKHAPRFGFKPARVVPLR
jgi:integrase